jgi:inorganic phosphate transporter, PiT family
MDLGPVLMGLAFVFAVANGANDGAALLSTVLGAIARPWVALSLLLLGLVLVPALVSSAVGRTLSERLVDFEADLGQIIVAGAVLAALVVVWVLTSRGLPTSLTLGLVGGLVGSGFGARSPVSWGLLGWVLLLAAAAPLLGAALAYGATLALQRVPFGEGAPRRVQLAHRTGYVLQCFAYGLNDGQKMLAVTAIAFGTSVSVAAAAAWPLAMIGAGFALGTLLTLRRVGGTVAGGLVPLRPLRSAVSGTSSAFAVITTGALGAPVSMTQSIAGSLVGSGAATAPSRVRWREVLRISGAWLFTLPAAFGMGAAFAAAIRMVR